jgi:hypothetical protein
MAAYGATTLLKIPSKLISAARTVRKFLFWRAALPAAPLRSVAQLGFRVSRCTKSSPNQPPTIFTCPQRYRYKLCLVRLSLPILRVYRVSGIKNPLAEGVGRIRVTNRLREAFSRGRQPEVIPAAVSHYDTECGINRPQGQAVMIPNMVSTVSSLPFGLAIGCRIIPTTCARCD